MTVSITPKFDLVWSGTGTTSTKDDWFDILSGSGYSAIPSGKQLWLGFASFGSDDKALTFEVRPNTAGQSTGTTGNTTLKSIVTVPSGESRDVDFDFFGNISVLAPVSAASTGVEKLWLRVRSGSVAASTFYYIIYFTDY